MRVLQFDMPKGAFRVLEDPVPFEAVCHLTREEVMTFLHRVRHEDIARRGREAGRRFQARQRQRRAARGGKT